MVDTWLEPDASGPASVIPPQPAPSYQPDIRRRIYGQWAGSTATVGLPTQPWADAGGSDSVAAAFGPGNDLSEAYHALLSDSHFDFTPHSAHHGTNPVRSQYNIQTSMFC
jgi:hypothetical protein